MVRVRIIKTTKYAHVKDGEVADSIADEHNVLATFFPALFHRRRTETDRTADGIWSDGGRNPIGRRTRTVAHLGGALVSSAPTEQELHQPSKKCANRARMHQQSKNTPTEQELRPLQAPSVVTFSHRTHRTHRIYCCVFSHRFHGNTQIVRVQKNKNNGLSGWNGFSLLKEENPINPFNPLLIYSSNEIRLSVVNLFKQRNTLYSLLW